VADVGYRVVALTDAFREDSDRAWTERVYPRLEAWIRHLGNLELDYQRRIAAFLHDCQHDKSLTTVEEIRDKLAHERMERGWGAITEYFESVMPEQFLGRGKVEFFVETEGLFAWWTADTGDEGLNLSDVILECLQTAGEYSSASAKKLVMPFMNALYNGHAPLPGFDFDRGEDGIAIWVWTSPAERIEKESLVEHDAMYLSKVAPEAAQQLQFAGLVSLPDSAASSMPALVSSLRKCGLGPETVLQEVGTPLSISALRAVHSGDIDQFAKSCGAMMALKEELEDVMH
jgi:hypothetical protein